MKYLADVNVLSEPTKTHAEPRVVQWLLANHEEIVVDPIVIGELWEGFKRCGVSVINPFQ